MENKDSCVSERVMSKITVATPSAELVNAYLGEIAKGYSVDWAPRDAPKDDGENDPGGGGLKESFALQPPQLEPPLLAELPAKSPPTSATDKAILSVSPATKDEESSKVTATAASPTTTIPLDDEPEDDFEALARRFAALKKR